MSNFPPEPNQTDDQSRGNFAGPPLARPIAAAEFVSAIRSDPMLLREIGRLRCLLELVFFVVAVFTSQILAVVVANLLFFDDEGGDMRFLEVGVVVIAGVLAVMLAIVINKSGGLKLASLGLTGKALRANLGLGLAITAATFVVFWMGILAIFLLWPAGYQSLLDNPQNIHERLPRMTPVALIGFSAIISIWEEVAFRGFFLPRLRRLTGSWIAAVLLSSGLFAVLHLEMQAAAIIIPLFFIAVLWCLVTIWRRSLVPVIIAHFLLDLIQLLWMTSTAPEWQ